tara:strand:+ start:1032 stop:1910 length:879 start_codon:yes stop_codon:yes gene_type:complete
MPNFKKEGRGFKMKGFSPFTKKTDPPKTKAKYNANQTDERVFDINQEKYNKWNRTMNRGKGPDVRYLGTKENNPHLENYLKWKKSGASPMKNYEVSLKGSAMKKKDDKKAIRTLKDREGNVIKSDTINLVPITEHEFFHPELHDFRNRKKRGTGAIIGETVPAPKPPRQKNKKPKTGLEPVEGKGGLKLSPLKKDDDPKNQKKMSKDVQPRFQMQKEVKPRLQMKKTKTKRVPAIPRKSTQFNEANASEKAILRQMNTIEGQLSKIKDKNSNRYKSLTSKHRDLDNQLWSYD